ncbi:hypothetical protein [Oceanobacter antarcticus]|uniref:Uncharacterized protein n=1 Tax=Oceanobacter antarcticus TaxID=3133425 RepID=A0ABW8NDW8_9GAMM
MEERKGEAKNAFTRATSAQSYTAEQTKSPVPEMIKQDEPVPQPTPPGLGQDLDRQRFNQRWQAQKEQSKALDPFEAIEAKKQGLTQTFNGEVKQRSSGRERE